MDLASSIAGITAIFDGLKALTGLADSAKQVEFNNKLIELQTRVMELQRDMSKVFAENSALSRANDDMKALIANRAAGIIEDSVVWTRPTNESRTGPYCPVCFAEKSILIPLVLNRFESNDGTVGGTCIQHDSNQSPLYHVRSSLLLEAGHRVSSYREPLIQKSTNFMG